MFSDPGASLAWDEQAKIWVVRTDRDDALRARFVVMAAAPRLAFIAECTPGYYNAEGDMKMINARNGAYQAGPIPFVRAIEAWRAAGDMRGLALTRD